MNTNNIITFCLLIGLLLITLSFVMFKRKAMLMLRALFSTRYLQQLLREGKMANERIFFFTILAYLIAFPCIVLAFQNFYMPELFEAFEYPALLYGVLFAGTIVALSLSQLFLWYFTAIFNYQEQRYLYTTIKALYRFYHTILLICIIPVIWFAQLPKFILVIYIPLFIFIFSAFIIRFLSNITGVSRIHFFIYFCSLEILPYLLLLKFFANYL